MRGAIISGNSTQKTKVENQPLVLPASHNAAEVNKINISQFGNQNCFSFAGIEISDVLKIDDKDYSITFSLYFNVQWSEPRLNLSQEFFNSENISSEDHLVPGKWNF